MARRLRVEYTGAIYHVMNRGDRREPIFKDEADRRRFVETLAEACTKTNTGSRLRSHVESFSSVDRDAPAEFGRRDEMVLGTYTSRFNRRHRLSGHLFSGRYKSLIVDGSSSGYLRSVCDYVHLNPARAKLVKVAQPLKRFAWSSWPAYLLAPSSCSTCGHGIRIKSVDAHCCP